MARASRLPFKPRLKVSERRAIIEREAAALFAAHGYDASSLDEIAKAAGITKRVIYDHYESKRDLHVTLLRRQAVELLSFVAARVQSPSPTPARLRAGVEAFFEFVEQHPYAWRMLFRDPPADEAIAAAHQEIQARATDTIKQFLADDADLRAATASHGERWLEMMAQQLKVSVNGLAGWWYEHQDVTRDQVVAAAVDFAWKGIEGISKGVD